MATLGLGDEIVSAANSALRTLELPSAADVAVLMAEEGIKGKPYGIRCPMAKYLRLKVGHDVGAIVGDGDVIISVSSDEDGYRSREFKLPTVASMFVSGFDKGEYPELLSNES